jgi:hypothetical protein
MIMPDATSSPRPSSFRTSVPTLLCLAFLPVLAILASGCGGAAGGSAAEKDEPLSEIREPQRHLGLRMEVDGLLGENEAGEKALLGRPTDVRVDSEGNVYVVDLASLKIKVYDRQGTLLRELGERGRGSGQFLRIHAFHVDRQDRVIVADGSSRRLTVMSKTGEVLFEREMDTDEMLWPREIQQLEDGRMVFLYKLPPERRDGSPWPENEFFLHVYDEDLIARQAVLATVDEFGPIEHFLNDSYSQIRPGHFWQRRDGSILFAPGLYRGQIHVYRETEGDWQLVDSWQGYVAQDPPLVEVDVNAEHRYLNFQVTQEGSKRAAQIRNESRGVFELADGRVVHFSVLTAGDEVLYGAEVFSPQGQLEGYGVLPQITDHHHTEQFYIDWKDEEDRFYVREATDRFVVWIARLTLGEQLEGPVWGVRPVPDHGAMDHGAMDHGAMEPGDSDHGEMNHGPMMQPSDESADEGDHEGDP